MINVLHVTYDMRIGGTEMVIKNIIEGNQDEAINMSIFCIEEPLGPWGKSMRASGLSITCRARVPGFDVKLIMALRKHILIHKIDIVHCHQYTPWVYGTFAAALTKARVVFTEHGRFYPDSSSWKRKIVNPFLLNFTSRVTAISQATKEALVEYEFVPKSKIEVVYNGISPLSQAHQTAAIKKDFGIPVESFVFGTVARLDPIKNQKMMLRAFAEVLKKRTNIFLVIVGDGEMREELEQLTSSLNIERNVVFTGYNSTPSELIESFDVFLLSSLSEGTSMTLLEAMSLGKPCIVTDAGGNPEVIEHNFNGLVCPNNDQDSFAQACLSITDRNLLEMSRNCMRRFNEKFSVQSMLTQYNRIWKSIKC
tara:strand:+ start:1088 stop:2185 length:1098 start_codon:yes stop_codon:yes gene_type:complete